MPPLFNGNVFRKLLTLHLSARLLGVRFSVLLGEKPMQKPYRLISAKGVLLGEYETFGEASAEASKAASIWLVNVGVYYHLDTETPAR